MIRALCILVMMWLPCVALGQSETHAYPQYYSVFTNDFANILSDAAETRINTELQRARTERGLEMAVVTIRSRADYAESPSLAAFAKRLFNGWGIGDKERNDGILLLVAIEDQQVRLALGAGYAAREDGIAARIIQTEIIPAFEDGRIADGLFNGTVAALEQLSIAPPATAAEPQAAPVSPAEAPVAVEQPPLPRETGLSQRISQWLDSGLDRVNSNPFIALILGIATLVAGFFGVRGIQQYRPRKCPECGRVMLRLGEAQEDQYLEHGQLVEERLKSKNYGVWFCPRDEHVTVIGYPSLFKRRKACPSCDYHTLETAKVVTMPASTVAYGQARLDHKCQNCWHAFSETITLPKLATSSSSHRGGSGFSSSSSSGFGGGGSSGGGGSGSW